MAASDIGRNDPCPCGSGKQFKHCCLRHGRSAPSDSPNAVIMDELKRKLAAQDFASEAELQTAVNEFMHGHNTTPRDDLAGLSPEQMHRLLNHPFDSPSLLSFPETLESYPQAPIVILFELLTAGIGEKGLKPTATGNLPRNFCRETALEYWGSDLYRQIIRRHSPNSELDFSDLHVTRLVAQLAGLIRKYKGRFILSRECRSLLRGSGLAGIYPRLFRAYVQSFNWAYLDIYPEDGFIQSSFAFTLYLLTRHGAVPRSNHFYEDELLRVFPQLLDEQPMHQYISAEEQIRACYTRRSLSNFAELFGLAEINELNDDPLDHELQVQKTPLLREVVRFNSV